MQMNSTISAVTMTIKVNPAYEIYKANPSKENYEQLGDALYHFIQATIARKFGSRFNELQDAIGETVCEIIKDLDSFDPSKGSFAVWVVGVVDHTCLDMRRRKIRRREQIYVDEQCGTPDAPYITRLFIKELQGRLLKEERKLMELKMGRASNEEIAAELGTTVDGVKGKWKRLLLKLRTLGGGEG